MSVDYNHNQGYPAGALMPAESPVGDAPSIVLRPSDMTFVWQECHRCSYNSIIRSFKRPSAAFPKIFQAIDEQIKAYFIHTRTEAAGLSTDVPPGEFSTKDVWVASKPLVVPGMAGATVVIKGCIDTVITLDDGTLCICDFKTSAPSSMTAALYARQLNAYAIALKYAASSSVKLSREVTRIGLLTFSPNRFALRPRHHPRITGNAVGNLTQPDSLPTSEMVHAYLGGSLTWTELPLDEAAFGGFVATMMRILTAPEPPAPSSRCRFCRYGERLTLSDMGEQGGGES